MNKITSALSWLVPLIVPVALIGLAVRLILLPAYLQVEYHMPSFPADDYGFSTADRLHWAGFAWNYLVNASGISYLGDLRLPDGEAVFNERELSHMQDVKRVVQATLWSWAGALAALLLLGIWAWTKDWRTLYLEGLRRGGWLTIGLAGLIGSIVAVGMSLSPDLFWEFFTVFHALFFKGDSWLFAYSDTLIRLFPIRFWQDTFLMAALIVLGGGLVLALGLRQRVAPMHDV